MRRWQRVGARAAEISAARLRRLRIALLGATAAGLLIAAPAAGQSDLEVVPADASALSKPYRSTIPQFRRRPPPPPPAVPAAGPDEPAAVGGAGARSWRDPPPASATVAPEPGEPPRFVEPDEPEAEEPQPRNPAAAPSRSRRVAKGEDEPAPAARPAYVGVWGPNAAACAARRSARGGFLPAIIQPNRAVAGRTTCRFGEVRRVGAAYVTAATCRSAGRRWTSNVRLTVEGHRLVWTSERGSTSYLRCGRS
ncbi:MAG: hypothetical protein PGN34_13895 [Methylobacterium frigidaeris]